MHFHRAAVLLPLGIAELALAVEESPATEQRLDLNVPLATQHHRLDLAQQHSAEYGPYGTMTTDRAPAVAKDTMEETKRRRVLGHSLLNPRLMDKMTAYSKSMYVNDRARKNAEQHKQLDKHYKTRGKSPFDYPKRVREMQELDESPPDPFKFHERGDALKALQGAHADERKEMEARHYAEGPEGLSELGKKGNEISGMAPWMREYLRPRQEKEAALMEQKHRSQDKVLQDKGETMLPMKVRQQMHLGQRNAKDFREGTYTKALEPDSSHIMQLMLDADAENRQARERELRAQGASPLWR